MLKYNFVKSLTVGVAVWAALALAVAGCGSSGSSTSSTNASGSAGANSSTGEAADTGSQPIEAARGPEPKPEVPGGPPPRHLVVKDLKVGSGPEAEVGDELTIQFVTILYADGERLESTWADPGGLPFAFTLGPEAVSPGWVRGMRGMKLGGRRELIIPPPLTYLHGVPSGVAPAGATLLYVIDLLELNGATAT